jgi:hypothetical protein
MGRRYIPYRRQEGYYEGASGRRSQFEFDEPGEALQGGFHTYGDDARWKNDTHARHHNLDHFGLGTRERNWYKNLDNQVRDRNHFGKGPKGYRRSSDRIYEDVCEALTLHPEVDAREIEINLEDGVVTLSGTVEGRRMKRLAEMVSETIPGVEDVVNLLRPIGTPLSDKMITTASPLDPHPKEKDEGENQKRH